MLMVVLGPGLWAHDARANDCAAVSSAESWKKPLRGLLAVGSAGDAKRKAPRRLAVLRRVLHKLRGYNKRSPAELELLDVSHTRGGLDALVAARLKLNGVAAALIVDLRGRKDCWTIRGRRARLLVSSCGRGSVPRCVDGPLAAMPMARFPRRSAHESIDKQFQALARRHTTTTPLRGHHYRSRPPQLIDVWHHDGTTSVVASSVLSLCGNIVCRTLNPARWSTRRVFRWQKGRWRIRPKK